LLSWEPNVLELGERERERERERGEMVIISEGEVTI